VLIVTKAFRETALRILIVARPLVRTLGFRARLHRGEISSFAFQFLCKGPEAHGTQSQSESSLISFPPQCVPFYGQLLGLLRGRTP
jgi:hypothetical protein